jgi:signal transduction histidine kinase/CHASE3 domain sensor protein
MHSNSLKITKFSALLVIVYGILVIIGWIFDFTFLKNISPDLISIKVNTAVLFIMVGFLLLLRIQQINLSLNKNYKLAFWFLLVLVIFIASVTLVEYFSGKNFGIDQIFFKDLDKQSVFPGRMAPNTSILFLFSAISILLLSPRLLKRNSFLSAVLSLISVIACLFSLDDYPKPGMGNVLGYYNPMAYPTAFAFIILGLGTFTLAISLSKISWSLKRGITIGFIIGLSLILGVSLFSNSSTISLRETYIWVAHTDNVRFLINELQTDLEDIELNRQNYLLFIDVKYRDLSVMAADSFRSELRIFKDLTKDNPNQQYRVKQLDSLVSKRFILLNKTFLVFQTGNLEHTIEFIRESGIPELNNKINNILSDADNEEVSLLKKREENTAASTQKTFILLPVAALASLAILVWVFILLNSEVTERIKTEEHVKRVSRLYSVLSRISHTMVQTDNKQELFDETCRILVEEGRFKMAWIGGIDESTKIVKPVASFGNDDGYLNKILISINDSEFQKGPTGISIVTGQHNVCNDIKNDTRMAPWRDHALKLNFRSSAAFPVKQKNKFPAPLTVYSSELGFFDESEIKLMNEISLEISFALESLEKEDQKKKMVTELRIKEEELSKSNEDLLRSNTELEQFAYVASHDLQEPLRMVASYTQLLGKRYKDKLDNDAHDFINFAVDGASRMQRLINDLLDYSRVTTKGNPFVTTDLSSVIGLAITNLHNKIIDSGTIVINDAHNFVYGDEIQLMRVFQNLIDNAIKFKSADVPKIYISSSEVSGKILVSVKDNGIGIDPKYKDRVFVIFQRLHGSSSYPGTGIGLAICKRTIERHGGNIWLESEPGNGTTFFFTLNKRN